MYEVWVLDCEQIEQFHHVRPSIFNFARQSFRKVANFVIGIGERREKNHCTSLHINLVCDVMHIILETLYVILFRETQCRYNSSNYHRYTNDSGNQGYR
jgi:hypothetical protein